MSKIDRTRYTKYDKALELVSKDIKSSLNIVNLLHRIRLHGFALALLVETPLLKYLSSVTKGKRLKISDPEEFGGCVTKFKPLKYPEKKFKSFEWEANDTLSMGDRMLVFLLKKVQAEMGSKALAKHFINYQNTDNAKKQEEAKKS